MKNGKYSISDVAEMLGVSKSTVSRVINAKKLWILWKKSDISLIQLRRA